MLYDKQDSTARVFPTDCGNQTLTISPAPLLCEFGRKAHQVPRGVTRQAGPTVALTLGEVGGILGAFTCGALKGAPSPLLSSELPVALGLQLPGFCHTECVPSQRAEMDFCATPK